MALSATATRGTYYARLAGQSAAHTVVIGFDQDLMLPVRRGEIDSVVMQDTHAIGQAAMHNLLAEMAGEPVAQRTMIAPLLVTRDNLDSPRAQAILHFGQQPVTSESAGNDAAEVAEAGYLLEARKHALQPGVQQIGSFVHEPGLHPGVTIQGTVISLAPLLGVQDATASTSIARLSSSDPIKLGDVVAVHGDLVSERFRTRFQQASVKVLWSESPIAPLAVTANQLTAGYRGQSIEVESTVLAASEANGVAELILTDHDQHFRAVLYPRPGEKRQRIEAGTRVRLRGAASSLASLTGGVYPFTVVANKVTVLNPPPWWSPIHIMLLSIGLLMLVIGLLWLLHLVQRWHMRLVLHEREQLAFEIHDTLAQSFTGISYQLQAAQSEQHGEAKIKQHVQHALEMVSISHREASRTIAALRPQHRDVPGILSALKQLAERLGDGELAVHTAVVGRSSELSLEITEAFFRIGQEAISNAIQHGHCRSLHVEVRVTRRIASLTVRDDGIGFVPSLVTPGLGIAGMKDRSEKVKGTFSLASNLGHGTNITVICPLRFTGSLFYNLRTSLLRAMASSATV